MPDLMGTAICQWCDQRIRVLDDGKMVQHDDYYPTRICEGSNKPVPSKKVMEAICANPCGDCGGCHCG